MELVLIEWTLQRNKEKAAEELQSFGVAAGPINLAPDMLNDSHVIAREFFVPFERDNTPCPGPQQDGGRWLSGLDSVPGSRRI